MSEPYEAMSDSSVRREGFFDYWGRVFGTALCVAVALCVPPYLVMHTVIEEELSIARGFNNQILIQASNVNQIKEIIVHLKQEVNVLESQVNDLKAIDTRLESVVFLLKKIPEMGQAMLEMEVDLLREEVDGMLKEHRKP